MASRSYWPILLKDSSDTWVINDYIYRPNEDLSINDVANVQGIKTIDGNIVFVSAANKRNVDTINFVWDFVSEDLQGLIRYYIDLDELVKIQTHMSSEQYIGKFLSVQKIVMTGVEGDYYGTSATFLVQTNTGS